MKKNLFRHSTLAVLIASGLLAQPVLAAPTCQINKINTAEQPFAVIERADNECRNDWFSAPPDTLNSLFSEATIQQAQQQLHRHVQGYRGEDVQALAIENLGEFIRAAYYVRYQHQRQYGDYSEALDLSLAHTINTFLLSPYAALTGEQQIGALKSMTTMVDNIRQLPLTMANQLPLLDHFTRQTADNLQFVEALNNLFRAMSGHISITTFYDDLAAHPEYLTQLHQFILNNDWALETRADFIVTNAAREMGRLLVTPHGDTRQQVLTILEDLLHRYPLGGKSDKMWVGIAEMINYFAPEKAAELGLTNAKRDLEASMMPLRFACDGPAIIRAQAMTEAQAAEVCHILADKEADFHQVAATGNQPVADDLNSTVEVVVFDSNADYVSYSNFLFGNTTNNGGQYLEGNPAEADNQARFIAYRNEYADGYSILNLEHEYVHYLDGRFNLHGDFGDVLRHGHTVWWLEGFAEYMHYKQGYSDAIALGRSQKYSLTEVLATTYDHDVNRIYRWGYLAVRFFMENHPGEVNSLLALSRQGQFRQWADTAKALGEQYNEEFRQWLLTVEDTGSNPDNPGEPEQPGGKDVSALAFNTPITLAGERYSEHLFFIDVPQHTTSMKLAISGDGDADLFVSYNRVAHYYDYDETAFVDGSNELLSLTAEENGFIKTGRYYVSVTGREAFHAVTLTASAEINDPADQGNQQLPQGEDDLTPVVLQADQPQTFKVHAQRYLAVPVSEAGQTVRVWVTPVNATESSSQSDVNLYAAQAHWPTTETHDRASAYSGSQEYLELTANKAGYIHLLMTNQGHTAEVEVYVAVQ